MRRYGWVALLLIGMLAVGGALFRPHISAAEGESAATQRTLDVVGQGTVVMKYDTASLSFGVSELGATAVEAYAAMSAKMHEAAHVVQQKGIKPEQIKTGNFSIYAEYDWTQEGGQRLKGYRATNTVTVTTQKLDQVAELMQAVVGAGVNQIHGINFSVKDQEALIEQALDLAVDNAKARAERVAKRLGTSVAGVYKVNVNHYGGGPVAYDTRSMKAEASMLAGAPAPVFSGEGEISVTVSVTFELR